MSGRPVAMAVLASEQLWPNIQGLVYWHKHRGGVNHLCIYHTSDEKRSLAPAMGLARLCYDLYPHVQVHLSGQQQPAAVLAGDRDPLIQPQAVRAQLRAWRAKFPGQRLIVNATGGLKLMFAGVLDCLDLPETEVVYRELRGDEWYRLTRGPDGVQTEPFDVPLDVTDDIPVEALVGCQWKPANGTWTTEKPHHLRVADLVRQARAHNWNWQEAFKACNLPSQDQLGVLFERFVAASLLALGIKQVARNCRLWVGDKTLLEVDLVANHGGRLLIIDCKLRRREDKRVEGITSQIRQAAEIRRRLGGLAAELLLLRPGMTLSEEERQIAESHGLKVLDASCTLQFFQHLWTFVGGTGGLPKEAAEAQAYLDVAAKEGDLEALAGSIRGPLGDSPVPIRTILDFDAILNDVRNFVALQGQDWVVYKLQGAYVLCGYTEEKLSPQDLKAMVSKHFAIAKIKQIQRSNTGLSFWTTLEIPTKDDIEKLHDLLRSYTGKRLFRT